MFNVLITVGTKFNFPKVQKFLFHENIDTEITDQVILKKRMLQVVVREQNLLDTFHVGNHDYF